MKCLSFPKWGKTQPKERDETLAELFNIKVGGSFDLSSLDFISYKNEIESITNCFEDDEVLSNLKRTYISGDFARGQVNDELLFVRYFHGKVLVYLLIHKGNMSMIAVKVGGTFIFLEKGYKVDEVVSYLEGAGALVLKDVLWYDFSKKNMLKFESVTYSLEELKLDVDYLALITKSNIEDNRHCLCFLRAFGCFVVPAVLSDWKFEIGQLLDAENFGILLDSYTLPEGVAGQWANWESLSALMCSEGEKDKGKGKMDEGTSVARSAITIVLRSSIPRSLNEEGMKIWASKLGRLELSLGKESKRIKEIEKDLDPRLRTLKEDEKVLDLRQRRMLVEEEVIITRKELLNEQERKIKEGIQKLKMDLDDAFQSWNETLSEAALGHF